MKRSAATVVLTLVLILACSPLGLAQQQNPATQTELIQRLMTRIDELEKRVSELEALKTPAPVAARTQPEVPPPAPAGGDHGGHAPAAAVVESGEGPNLKIAGFSDFTFSGSNQPGTQSGFSEGQFILHLNSNLSPRVSYLGELSLSARSDAGTGSPAVTGFNAEVERSIIRFEQSDYFKVSFGRYHTPINYWNTAFHHGQWLQTTVSRPEMVQFGGKFIPVHFVGSLVEGALPAGGLNFNYNFGVGNGRGSVISRGGDFGDNNNYRATLVNLFVRPDRFYGLQLGGSNYLDKITSGGRNFAERISSAHVVWAHETPEIIGEFANVRHENLTTPSAAIANSQAYYIQTAYRLPVLERHWKPYYRFEYIHIPNSDTLFQTQTPPVPNLAGSVLGIRYDLANFAALKFEYRNQRRAPGQPYINSGFVQTSFTF